LNTAQTNNEEQFNRLHAQLMERIGKNLTDYHHSLMDFGKQELIDMAGKISAMSDAHIYMTSWHGFSDDELRFYLAFQNPLEVLADAWNDRSTDLDDMGFVMYGLFDKQDALQDYPLMRDAGLYADNSLRRFMGVDLLDFLGRIAEKTIIYYPNDWNIDKDILQKAATSYNPEEKRLIWHVCSTGTHIKPERDVFIRDSGPYGYMTGYHENDPDMFGYAVEVTGRDGQHITGNVFEVGVYSEYARNTREAALPLSYITLKYADDWGVNSGKTITVSRREYDDDRHRLMSESGNVISLRWHPADEADLSVLLQRERSRRMTYPIGSPQAHLEKLSETLAEVRRPSEQAVKPPEPKKKQSITDRLHDAGTEAKAYNAQRSHNPVNSTKKHKKEID